MRNNFRFMASLAAIAFGVVTAPQAMHDANALPSGLLLRERRGKGQNNRRGKGKVDRPKRRSNMITVSKRVRRKHRRAA